MVEYARRDECSMLCERYGKNRKTLDMQDMVIAGIHYEKNREGCFFLITQIDSKNH